MDNGIARGGVAVTKHDTNENKFDALYIGVTGDVAVVTKERSASVIFKAHPVGYMPVSVVKVLSTGTTATDIVGLLV